MSRYYTPEPVTEDLVFVFIQDAGEILHRKKGTTHSFIPDRTMKMLQIARYFETKLKWNKFFLRNSIHTIGVGVLSVHLSGQNSNEKKMSQR